MWIKKTSKIPYLELLGRIDADIVTNPLSSVVVTEIPGGEDRKLSKKRLWIRHDVDKDLDHALRFAEYEYKNDIKSTYFLLHTADYFDYSSDFAEKITLLAAMDHEIGFHNDVLAAWWKGKLHRLGDIYIKKPLGFLREYAGSVVGTSCHGYVECYDRQYFNYQIWSEYDPAKNEGFEILWPRFSLKEFDLEYEAYFMDYTHYYSDSGGNDIGYVVDGKKHFERTALQSPKNIGIKIIDGFNKEAEGLFQLLVHPIHWEEV
jgi:hypothetical protein